jgi:hypothetical protein
MVDETEQARRALVEHINDSPKTREELNEMFGADQVWDTTELQKEFDVQGFMAPFCIVIRKKDNVRGVVTFQHHPRLYFAFAGD